MEIQQGKSIIRLDLESTKMLISRVDMFICVLKLNLKVQNKATESQTAGNF